ncbi:MAG: hypothetical protein IJ347_01170 [Faecalibacterium sp.]|nr:hypothetical protein [Faecalibacterium sp.]
MQLTRITEEDLALYPGVRGQETVPRISVEEKQAKFEERAEKVIVPAFNRLCDELEEAPMIKIGGLAPAKGPMIWFDTGDTEETPAVMTLSVGDGEASAVVDGVAYSLQNTTVEQTPEEGDYNFDLI